MVSEAQFVRDEKATVIDTLVHIAINLTDLLLWRAFHRAILSSLVIVKLEELLTVTYFAKKVPLTQPTNKTPLYNILFLNSVAIFIITRIISAAYSIQFIRMYIQFRIHNYMAQRTLYFVYLYRGMANL